MEKPKIASVYTLILDNKYRKNILVVSPPIFINNTEIKKLI
jgi:hypothetical protein